MLLKARKILVSTVFTTDRTAAENSHGSLMKSEGFQQSSRLTGLRLGVS